MGGWVVGMHVPSLSFHLLKRRLCPCWYFTIPLALFLLLLLFQPMFNPLSPIIYIQILQTDLYTFKE